MRRLLATASAALAALALVGCSGPVTPTTLDELAQEYRSAGGECASFTQQYRSSDRDPAVAVCGDATTITLANDREQAGMVATGAILSGATVLVGDRWIVDDPGVVSLREAMGGEVLALAERDGPMNFSDGIRFGSDGVVAAPAVAAGDRPASRSDDGVVTVVVDVACEYCMQFLATNVDELERLANSGDATVEYRLVSLQDSMANGFSSSVGANALACAASAKPEAFVPMLRSMAQAYSESGYTAAELTELAAGAGADASDCIAEGSYLSWTRASSNRAINTNLANGEPLHGVPTVIAGADVYAESVVDAEAFAAWVATKL